MNINYLDGPGWSNGKIINPSTEHEFGAGRNRSSPPKYEKTVIWSILYIQQKFTGSGESS